MNDPDLASATCGPSHEHIMKTRNRVLIFDDDAEVGHCIALLAEHFDVDAVSVCLAAEFFNAVEQWRPTHIILDLIMPEIDGMEVLQSLADTGCVSQIAISSGAGANAMSTAKNTGISRGLNVREGIPKPLTVSAFRDFILGEPKLPSLN